MSLEQLMYWVNDNNVRLSNFIECEVGGIKLVGCGATYVIPYGVDVPALVVGDVKVAVTLAVMEELCV